MTAPLTAERRRAMEAIAGMNSGYGNEYISGCIADLLAEIDRLTAERDAAVAAAVMAERETLRSALRDRAEYHRALMDHFQSEGLRRDQDYHGGKCDGLQIAASIVYARPAPAPAVEGRTP